MFEWFYLFWKWLSEVSSSDEYWQPYLNMGNLFWIIVSGMVIIYFVITFQPWNWFMKDDEDRTSIR